MKQLLALVLSTPVTSVAQATPLGTANFTSTSINFPGATLTRGLGLNDHGDIVGDYIDSSGVRHGYLLCAENFSSLDAQGSIQTRAIVFSRKSIFDSGPACGRVI